LVVLGSTIRSDATPPAAIATAAPILAPTAANLDVAAYAQTMVQHSTRISGALSDIGRLSKTPRVTDPNWKIDMATAFTILRDENTAIQQITPPASMREAHAEILLATADFDAMTYRYAAGIDAMDTSEIEAAIQLMRSGSQHITRATELMHAK
jgi:hypothetical protein